MKKHIYLHTSGLEQTKTLRDDPNFERPYEYTQIIKQRTFPNEYGRIKTRQNYYHILIGSMKQTGCPWCGNEPELIKTKKDQNFTTYCFTCPICLSKGPTLNIRNNLETEESMEHFKEVMKHRYTHRRPWDADFVNPYENE